MENQYGVGLYQDGTFFFTNPGLFKRKDKEGNETTDFSTLWNNKEYTFKGKTTTPLIISGEPPENVQHIRKQFAKNYATAWFFTTKRYKEMVKKGGYIPATYNEDQEYKDTIQACLTALPKSQAKVQEMPKITKESDFKGTKAVGKNTDLNVAFAEYNIPTLGEQ